MAIGLAIKSGMIDPLIKRNTPYDGNSEVKSDLRPYRKDLTGKADDSMLFEIYEGDELKTELSHKVGKYEIMFNSKENKNIFKSEDNVARIRIRICAKSSGEIYILANTNNDRSSKEIKVDSYISKLSNEQKTDMRNKNKEYLETTKQSDDDYKAICTKVLNAIKSSLGSITKDKEIKEAMVSIIKDEINNIKMKGDQKLSKEECVNIIVDLERVIKKVVGVYERPKAVQNRINEGKIFVPE